MLTGFFHCCDSQGDVGTGELKVIQLSSDVLDCSNASQPVHLLTQRDSFDMTMSPRTACKGEQLPSRFRTFTPRQQSLHEQIWLPNLRRYPVPPTCSPDDPEDVQRQELLRVYQDFVMDLHKGIHMTQLTSKQDYSDIHCQIREDLQTLQVDQGSGCIIEFPLRAVSKVYRIVKNDDRWYSAGSLTGPSPIPPLPLSNAEHIVVIEFMRRKLPFVFTDMKAAQRFLMCIELLIRRAQESRGEVELSGSRGHAGEKKGVAPMFSTSSFGNGRENIGGERLARPLLPLSAAQRASHAPGRGATACGDRQRPPI